MDKTKTSDIWKDSNILVAAIYSGKTAVLVERIIRKSYKWQCRYML